MRRHEHVIEMVNEEDKKYLRAEKTGNVKRIHSSVLVIMSRPV